MFVALRIITLPPDRKAGRDELVAALRSAAEALPKARSSWVAPVSSQAVINGGDVVWRITFQAEVDSQAATLDPVWRTRIAPLLAETQVTGLGYRVTRSGVKPAGKGVWRALIFRVMPGSPSEAVKEMEAGLLLFPKYIPAIRSWALSPVADVEGPKAFTHVWEQEFDSVGGLTGAYMDHPIHWGLVDAWYDAEYPQYMVDPHLIQVVGDIDRSIMD